MKFETSTKRNLSLPTAQLNQGSFPSIESALALAFVRIRPTAPARHFRSTYLRNT